MPFYLHIHIYTCLLVYLSIYPPVDLSSARLHLYLPTYILLYFSTSYLSTFLNFCLSIRPPVDLFTSLFVHLSIYHLLYFSTFIFVYLFTCPPVFIPNSQFICQTTCLLLNSATSYLSTFLPFHLSTRPNTDLFISLRLSTYPFLYVFTYLRVYLPTCSSSCLHIHLSISLPVYLEKFNC